MNATTPTTPTTPTPPRRRLDQTLIGQLNLEWAQLRADTATTRQVADWAADSPVLRGHSSLADIEHHVAAANRATADAVLLALIELAQNGDQLAGRTTLQLMLGKAVRIAATHTGRADRDLLEQLAVTALWDTIATYPVSRRRHKVAANLAMDTLHKVVAELSHTKHEAPTDPTAIAQAEPASPDHTPADLELLETLAWGVNVGVITHQEAILVLDVYSPAPNTPGGAAAAAHHGLTWAAARQRCSRAIRRLATAVHADTIDAAAV